MPPGGGLNFLNNYIELLSFEMRDGFWKKKNFEKFRNPNSKNFEIKSDGKEKQSEKNR